MKKIRLFCRSANTYGYYKNKVGFDIHNFRLDKLSPEERNYAPSLSHHNVIFRCGDIIEQSQITDFLALVKKDQQEKMKKVRGNMSSKYIGELNLARSKTKSKLMKWAKSAQNPLEKTFFNDLLIKLSIDKIYAKNELERLSGLGKIKRFNDKKRAIEKLEECNKLFSVNDNTAMSLKVISSEKIFKIPDKHGINVSAEDWNTIIGLFHSKFYKDYDVYYTAIHLDEKCDNPHAHHRISGFNNITQQFDLPDHELNLVRKIYNKPDLFNGRQWSQLKPHEVERFGELYQNIIFKFCNTQLQKLGYNVKAVKRTPEEVKQDAHSYSNAKIRHRLHNGVQQLNKQKNELIKHISELKAEEQQSLVKIDNNKELAVQWEDKARQERRAAIDWNKKAKEQKRFFERTKNNVSQWFEQRFEKWFNSVLKFKKSNLDEDLTEPVSLHVELTHERQDAGQILLDEVEQGLKLDQLRRYERELARQLKENDRTKYK